VNSGWNHNIEYHKVVLAALGAGQLTVLDVGCGDGALARELSALGHQVTAIDVDEPSIGRARLAEGPPVDLVCGDFMSFPFERESFDAVVSIAALHHMSQPDALHRMASLLRSDGTLVVVGLARSQLPRDLPWAVAGAVMSRARRVRNGGYREVTSPTVWPPASTYRQMRDVATAVLPGVHYRRHTMWRYSLVWSKRAPAAGSI
jgi:2-polyprenyl-3-methyl-5-hydroxy-6-metoxy-1,4-benzoquinol methylase